MTPLQTEPFPSPALVAWAAAFARMPTAPDRPWFLCAAPRHPVKHHDVTCRCRRPIRLWARPCEDGDRMLYIAQCGYCSSVIWSYLEARNP